MNYKLSYPAINGETVTQGHADYCKAEGHGTHTVNGVVSPLCPRCGQATNSIESEGNQMTDFDSMTTAQLKAYARENYSTISKLTKRDQLIRALGAQQAKAFQASVMAMEFLPAEGVTKFDLRIIG